MKIEQNEIIALAREAGFHKQDETFYTNKENLERFAALVSAEAFTKGFAEGVEATKEKAAQVCEEVVIENGGKTARNKTSFECAAVIRNMK